MFTAPLARSSAKSTEDEDNETGKKKPQPIIDMMRSRLTPENISELGFVSFKEVDKQFQIYLSDDWEAGYGGLPRCLRICLFVHSLLILKQKFGVKTWTPDLDEAQN